MVRRTLSRVVEVELLGAKQRHERVEDQELAGGECADHDATRSKPHSGELTEADFASNAPKARQHATRATSTLLVHLGQQRVGRVRDDGGSDAGNNAR